MQEIINHIDNIKLKIEVAAGAIVIIELKLRLLAETNSSFRDEVYRQIKAPDRDAKNNKRNEYWNCSLQILCSAMQIVFANELTLEQKKIIDFFKKPRDKTLHGDLVGLLITLGVSQDGQQIFSSGKRNQLVWSSRDEAVKNQLLKQAILRFD